MKYELLLTLMAQFVPPLRGLLAAGRLGLVIRSLLLDAIQIIVVGALIRRRHGRAVGLRI